MDPLPAFKRKFAVLAMLSTLHASCGTPRGASRVVDPLGRVAGRMNLSGATDGQWEYRPETPADYWLVVAPSGTTPAELKQYELPALTWRAAQSCLESGHPFVLLAEAAQTSCVHPVLVPDVPELFVIQKRAGESTVFSLRRDKGSAWLAGLR